MASSSSLLSCSTMPELTMTKTTTTSESERSLLVEMQRQHHQQQEQEHQELAHLLWRQHQLEQPSEILGLMRLAAARNDKCNIISDDSSIPVLQREAVTVPPATTDSPFNNDGMVGREDGTEADNEESEGFCYYDDAMEYLSSFSEHQHYRYPSFSLDTNTSSLEDDDDETVNHETYFMGHETETHDVDCAAAAVATSRGQDYYPSKTNNNNMRNSRVLSVNNSNAANPFPNATPTRNYSSIRSSSNSNNSSSAVAIAFFWEKSLWLYAVCFLFLPALHHVFYDTASGKLWMQLVAASIADHAWQTYGQPAMTSVIRPLCLSVQTLVCSSPYVDCPEWQLYWEQEIVQPATDYLCSTDNIEEANQWRTESIWSLLNSASSDSSSSSWWKVPIASPSFWAHRIGFCPLPSATIPTIPTMVLRPVLSADMWNGWEHDLQIVVALGLVLTVIRLAVGLFSGLSSSTTTPTPTATRIPHATASHSPAHSDRDNTEPALSVPKCSDHMDVKVGRNTEENLKGDIHAAIVWSPTEETDRTSNATNRKTKNPQQHIFHNVKLVAKRTESLPLGTRSVQSDIQSKSSRRSLQSVLSSMSTTKNRMRAVRKRIVRVVSRRSSRKSPVTDDPSSTISGKGSIDDAMEQNISTEGKDMLENQNRETVESENSSLSDDVRSETAPTGLALGAAFLENRVDHPQQPAQVWIGSAQSLMSEKYVHSCSDVSIDSSISTRQDALKTSLRNLTLPIDKNPPSTLHDAAIAIPKAPILDAKASALFGLLCCTVAASQAWLWFRDANFWPWFVGGRGETSACWDLSGGLSIDMDRDFDHRNTVLKQYFVGQASFHWHSVTFYMLCLLCLRFQKQQHIKAQRPTLITVGKGTWTASNLQSLLHHALILALFVVVIVFLSLRRLAAIGVFAFDASNWFLYLWQSAMTHEMLSVSSSRMMFSWMVLPSFAIARFAIWPTLWYSAAFESSDWLSQLEHTLWSGSASTFRILCHLCMSLLIVVSVVDLWRLLVQYKALHECKKLQQHSKKNEILHF